jgi:uncharacterized protein
VFEGIVLFVIGFVGASVSGLVGIGGALVLIPLLLYVPPMLGITGLTVQEVSGISIAQVTAAGFLGVILHGRIGGVDRRLVLAVGLPMAVGAAIGGVGAAFVTERFLILVFAIMASFAFVLILIPSRAPPSFGKSVRLKPAAATGAGVGVLAGLVGAGGAFLLQPILIQWFQLNPRTVIGSSLGITLLGSLAGLAGKLLTSQVPLGFAAWTIAGVLPGIILGTWISRRLAVWRLRALLAIVVAAVCARAWLSVLYL